MAYTTIDDPSAHFQVKTYTGNNTQTAITYDGNSNLQPDWIWAKSRSNSHYHDFRDTSRGLTKRLYSNDSGAEDTKSASYVSFDSNGFTLGDDGGGSPANTVNSGSNNYVSWGWKANGGTTTTNDASSTGVGTIDSVYQANTTAGFSIVTYTGTGSAGTIAHGLGATPKIIIQKNRDEDQPWWTYVEYIGSGGQLRLNGTNAAGSDGGVLWNSTAPTSTVFSVGDNTGANGSADKCIAYCFAEKQGYSKFGSYKGNGNADGTFVYTGFKPAWLLIKESSGSGANWVICDNKRDTFNVMENILIPNTAQAEFDETSFDFLSNGFKLRQSAASYNDSGETFIYMAFAEHPFVSSKGVPTTAR